MNNILLTENIIDNDQSFREITNESNRDEYEISPKIWSEDKYFTPLFPVNLESILVEMIE